MSRDKISTIYKFAIILLGGCSLFYVAIAIPRDVFRWSFVFFAIFTLLVTPIMNIKFNNRNISLSFSDSVIFLAFVLYGGESAILIAAVETFANCYYLRKKGKMELNEWLFPYNVGAAAFATSVTYILWSGFVGTLGIQHGSAETLNLLPSLGILAIFQFLSLSIVHSIFTLTRTGKSMWQIWKNTYFSVSLTQLTGAAVAFAIYKLISNADFLTISIALIVIAVGYVAYRRTIADINESNEQAEKAEKDKAELAKQKAEEAEKHAGELEILLEKEAKVSQSLRRSKSELEYSAFHDALTDLPNRAYLLKRLKYLIELGSEVSKNTYLVFLDLSRFKNINDSLGHTVGDHVLKLVALRLRRLLRDEDTITRLGGDEFAIVLTEISSIEEAREIAGQIHESLTMPYKIQGNKIFSDINIGIAPFDYEHVMPEDILRDSDIAIQHAKDKNLNIAVFDKNIRAKHLERIRLEADLRHAVARNEFVIHYQPLISLEDGRMMGFEALLRWTHAELGFISPAQFIPISEDSGSIVPITHWILKQTCEQLVKWNSSRDENDQMLVSVNISARHIAEGTVVGDVKKALDESGLSPELLKLEMTESTAMDDAEVTIEILKELKELGVQLSIDDFGTGYSSLSYLHRIPFDTLKIDRSFVINAENEASDDLNILESIVLLTKNLKKKVIAEGIETEKQLGLLKGLNCDYGQGYLFSRPIPVDKMTKLLDNLTPWIEYSPNEIPDAPQILVNENLRPF